MKYVSWEFCILQYDGLVWKAPCNWKWSLDFKGPQYDRQQLFTFIEKELNEVIPNLKAARTNEYGRLDKAMAQMILAKMYLECSSVY
jgi:hypothetical protein